MSFWAVVGLVGALAVVPKFVRGLRSRWGPELRATLNAVLISVLLDLAPLVYMLIRERSPKKK